MEEERENLEDKRQQEGRMNLKEDKKLQDNVCDFIFGFCKK